MAGAAEEVEDVKMEIQEGTDKGSTEGDMSIEGLESVPERLSPRAIGDLDQVERCLRLLQVWGSVSGFGVWVLCVKASVSFRSANQTSHPFLVRFSHNMYFPLFFSLTFFHLPILLISSLFFILFISHLLHLFLPLLPPICSFFFLFFLFCLKKK